jgi:hypothetical protein
MKTKAMVSLFLVLCALVFGPRAAAYPNAPTLSNITSTQITIGGKAYYQIVATMNGTGIEGPTPYNVPVELLYPANPRNCNGTGIVDLLENSAMVLLNQESVAVPPLAAARARLTDKFLGEKGYSYVSVQWEKTRGESNVIEIFNELFGTNYVIPTVNDQFAIILDAASLLKAPPAGLPGPPCAVLKAAAYGFSPSTVPINALKQPGLVEPIFAAGFAALFDGVILDSIASGPLFPDTISKTGVKTIAVSSETDVQLFRNDVFMRGENPDYRSYEIAGTSHVTTDQHDLDDIVPLLPFPPSPPVQHNLAKDSAVHRAMMEHLRRWMAGGNPPPPSVSLDGSNYSLIPLPCGNLPIPGIANIPRDSDSNALGGIRLPHLATKVDRECVGNKCKTIGSPLGAYSGVETQYGCSPGGFPQVALVAGTYVRNDDIIDRYRNHGQYVSGVAKAAEYALEQGWILKEDLDAYIDSASACRVGSLPTEDLTQDDLKACHGL